MAGSTTNTKATSSRRRGPPWQSQDSWGRLEPVSWASQMGTPNGPVKPKTWWWVWDFWDWPPSHILSFDISQLDSHLVPKNRHHSIHIESTFSHVLSLAFAGSSAASQRPRRPAGHPPGGETVKLLDRFNIGSFGNMDALRFLILRSFQDWSFSILDQVDHLVNYLKI